MSDAGEGCSLAASGCCQLQLPDRADHHLWQCHACYHAVLRASCSVQALTVVPIMATLDSDDGVPTSLQQALADEIGLQYQVPASNGPSAWCVGSLDLNIGELI